MEKLIEFLRRLLLGGGRKGMARVEAVASQYKTLAQELETGIREIEQENEKAYEELERKQAFFEAQKAEILGQVGDRLEAKEEAEALLEGIQGMFRKAA